MKKNEKMKTKKNCENISKVKKNKKVKNKKIKQNESRK